MARGAPLSAVDTPAPKPGRRQARRATDPVSLYRPSSCVLRQHKATGSTYGAGGRGGRPRCPAACTLKPRGRRRPPKLFGRCSVARGVHVAMPSPRRRIPRPILAHSELRLSISLNESCPVGRMFRVEGLESPLPQAVRSGRGVRGQTKPKRGPRLEAGVWLRHVSDRTRAAGHSAGARWYAQCLTASRSCASVRVGV